MGPNLMEADGRGLLAAFCMERTTDLRRRALTANISVPLVLLRLTAVRKEYSHNSRLGQIDNEKKLVVDACMTYTPACPNEIRMLSERKNPIL